MAEHVVVYHRGRLGDHGANCSCTWWSGFGPLREVQQLAADHVAGPEPIEVPARAAVTRYTDVRCIRRSS